MYCTSSAHATLHTYLATFVPLPSRNHTTSCQNVAQPLVWFLENIRDNHAKPQWLSVVGASWSATKYHEDTLRAFTNTRDRLKKAKKRAGPAAAAAASTKVDNWPEKLAYRTLEEYFTLLTLQSIDEDGSDASEVHRARSKTRGTGRGSAAARRRTRSPRPTPLVSRRSVYNGEKPVEPEMPKSMESMETEVYERPGADGEEQAKASTSTSAAQDADDEEEEEAEDDGPATAEEDEDLPRRPEEDMPPAEDEPPRQEQQEVSPPNKGCKRKVYAT